MGGLCRSWRDLGIDLCRDPCGYTTIADDRISPSPMLDFVISVDS